MPKNLPRWTLVQHSGYGYAGKSGFAHAVETREISTLSIQRSVVRAGGVLFPSYDAAEDAAEAANYPEGNLGLLCNARGSFADFKVDSLKVYVPAESDEFALVVGVSVTRPNVGAGR